MSAAHMKNEGTEVGWGGLESLGLTQKELVLAEALQMEYDALSRLKQDRSETETVHIPSYPSRPSRPSRPSPCVEVPQSTSVQHRSALGGGSLLSSLSGSSPPPNPDAPPSVPPRLPPPRGDHNNQSPFILVDSEPTNVKDSNVGDLLGSGSGFLPKCVTPLSDETPPAIPPRMPINQSSLLTQEVPVSHDVNVFKPEVDQPKMGSGELNYDSINDSLLRLNSLHQPRGSQSTGDRPGKPGPRSRTLPPQVPPRTHVAALQRSKLPPQAPADLVRGCCCLVGWCSGTCAGLMLAACVQTPFSSRSDFLRCVFYSTLTGVCGLQEERLWM